MIDINFDVFSDTPKGKDPDSYSATLRRYHKILWSKPLPSGAEFDLDEHTPRLLHHKSGLGEFFLSSDAIGYGYLDGDRAAIEVRYKCIGRSSGFYKGTGIIRHIVDRIPQDKLKEFFSILGTIGAYIVFPSRKIEGKMTINATRGMNHKIQDRFDLTLECVRRFYSNEVSPLSDTLQRYASFFHLFRSFKGYVDFFLLQDLVTEDYLSINFFLPFKNFDHPPLPSNVDEYQAYKSNVTDFVTARNQRILHS